MNEGSGTTLSDFTALGNNGTIYGTLPWVAGNSGTTGDYSLSFNQNGANYVSIPLVGALQTIGSGSGAARSFTISAWVKPTSQSNYPEVWSFGKADNSYGRALFYQGGNSNDSYAWADVNASFQMTTGQTIGNGAWHNVTLVFDGSSTTNNYQFWYAGILKSQQSIAADQALALGVSLFLARAMVMAITSFFLARAMVMAITSFGTA